MKKWFAISLATIFIFAVFYGIYIYYSYSRAMTKSERELWRITEYTVSDPVIVNDLFIFNGSKVGSSTDCFCLYAVNKLTGEIIWTTEEFAVPYIEEAKRLRLDDPRVDMKVISQAGNVIYINLSYWDSEDNYKHTLFAIRSNDGKALWKADGAIDIDSFSNSIAETNQIFIGDNQGDLLAIDSNTGKELWRQKIYQDYSWDRGWFTHYNNSVLVLTYSSECIISPCGDLVYEKEYFEIIALTAKTGKLLWKSAPLYNRLFYSSSTIDDTLYIESRPIDGEDNRYATAMDLVTGELRWDLLFQDANEFRINTSTINVAFISITSYKGGINDFRKLSKFIAVDEFTGKIIWQFNTDVSHGDLSYLINDDFVYIGTKDGFVYALESTTGNVIWQTETKYFPVHFAIKGNSLITIYEERFVVALDLKTGSIKWIADTGTDSYWYVLDEEIYKISDKYLYIAGNYKMKVYAIDLETGNILWSWEHPLPVSSEYEINLMDNDGLYVSQQPDSSFWNRYFGTEWFFALKIEP